MSDHPHTREAIEREDVLRTKVEQFRVASAELIRLLGIEEESDNGNRFHPNRISSCRVLDGMQINQCLKTLRDLAEGHPSLSPSGDNPIEGA
jgi:hypothetical protein